MKKKITEIFTTDIEIPSNKSFGVFFTILFLIVAIFFLYIDLNLFFVIFTSLSFIFLLIVLIKKELLSPLNKAWMRFGFILSLIIAPIVLGFIFYGIFSPIAILMRLFGRDELLLKFKKQKSYWRIKDAEEKFENSFKNQF